MNASTGAITGKPTGPAVGTISFTVTVTDSESPTKTATQNLSIVITAPQLTVTTTTASLPTGVLGNTYSTTLAASGGAGAYTWAVTGGNASLPPGLTLNTATGVISGTPTATGQTTFTVTVTDSETPTAQTASASLTISVNNSAPLAITTTSSQLPTGITGTAYPSTTLQASGGVTPYTWRYSGQLADGLELVRQRRSYWYSDRNGDLQLHSQSHRFDQTNREYQDRQPKHYRRYPHHRHYDFAAADRLRWIGLFADARGYGRFGHRIHLGGDQRLDAACGIEPFRGRRSERQTHDRGQPKLQRYGDGFGFEHWHWDAFHHHQGGGKHHHPVPAADRLRWIGLFADPGGYGRFGHAIHLGAG